MLLDFLLATVIGAGVGVGELVGRYRDAPAKAVGTFAGGAYITLNAAASVTALALIRAFGWHFGISGGSTPTSTSESQRWTEVLVAGFGAMAFLRSSLFAVKVGDQSVAVGPGGFLQILLNATDTAVDRTRGTGRASDAAEIMKDVSFANAKDALPTICIALLQNLSAEDQAELRRNVDALSKTDMPDRAKTLSLGCLLMNVAGRDVLQAAVKALGSEIK